MIKVCNTEYKITSIIRSQTPLFEITKILCKQGVITNRIFKYCLQPNQFSASTVNCFGEICIIYNIVYLEKCLTHKEQYTS